MRLVMPDDVNERSRLVGWTVALGVFLVLGAVMVPHRESSLVFVPLLLLSALAGAMASTIVRYRAQRRPKKTAGMKWFFAIAAWFVSASWAMMYFSLEGGHIYHANRGGPIAASISGLACVLTTLYVLRNFYVLTSRKRP